MPTPGPSLDQATAEITEIFESCRQSPGKPFESRGFLNYLFDPPAVNLSNSWKGARHKVRFFRQVEAHFLISFPGESYDRNWTFDKFCEWVADRAGKPKVNAKLAEKYRRHDYGCLMQLLAVPVVLAGVMFYRGGFGDVLGAIVLLFPAMIGWTLFSSYRHYSKLLKRLKD
jgi:hypothetical protein